MTIYHNSQNTFYRCPFGAVTVNSEVSIRLAISDAADPCSVFLLSYFNDQGNEILMEADSREESVTVYKTVLQIPEITGLLFYCFRIECGDAVFYYGNNPSRLGGSGSEYESDPVPFQITVYQKDTVPSWYKSGVAYQIFPDRFCRSDNWKELQRSAAHSYYEGYDKELCPARPERGIVNNWADTPYYPRNPDGGVSEWLFFGGSIDGIRRKLTYLAEMGITILYLNPVFKAASNHKYDTFDYLKIDEAFGSEESFKELCDEAGRLGIKIILDGVFNHTGADSLYFNLYSKKGVLGAYQGEESPFYSWYSFTEGGYGSWWGVKDLPDIKEMTPSYMDFIFRGTDSVVRKWLRLGASGWRLDVADELPDEFIQGIRSAMKEEDPDSILLGEVWEDASNKTSYGQLRKYFQGSELHAVMNYPFRTASLDFMKGNITAGELSALLMSLKENYPRENFYASLNLIGSHDRARVLNELSDTRDMLEYRISEVSGHRSHAHLNRREKRYYKKGVSPADAVKAAFTIPDDKLDLAKNRLKALTMLQFTLPGVPCIYYGDEAGMTGWEDPYNRGPYPWGEEDPELMEHYRMLCSLRREYPVLTDGDFVPSACSDHVICFHRFDDEHDFRLYVNRGIFEWEYVVPDEKTGAEAFTLPPLGWKILSV